MAGVTARVHAPTRRAVAHAAPVRLAGPTMDPRAAQVWIGSFQQTELACFAVHDIT